MNKWSFLCGICDKEVIAMKGEEALEEKYLKVKKKNNKTKQNDKEMENEELEEGEEDGDEEEVKDDGEEDDGVEEDLEVIEDPFEEVVPKRGFRANKESKKEEPSEKQIPICHHFKKARCHHGLSGKQSFGGVEKCPFRHPQICGKLLRNGDHGRGGCRGQQDGCTKYHQVKMCFSSMNTRKCAHKECKNGYHVKGTVIQKKDEKEAEKKDVEQRPKIKPWEKEKSGVEKQPNGDNNVASFLGQMLLQQQEMMQQQQQQAQQQRNEQMHFQQQMMQMISRMGGAAESRPVTPMGAMLQPGPLSYRQVV